MANIDNEKTSKKSSVKSLEMSKLGLGRKTNSRWPSKAKQEYISKSVGSSLGEIYLDVGERQQTRQGEEADMANQMRQDKQKDKNPKSKEPLSNIRDLHSISGMASITK